jgi:hypothetical protein
MISLLMMSGKTFAAYREHPIEHINAASPNLKFYNFGEHDVCSGENRHITHYCKDSGAW